jgi:hypothetical protein
VNFSERWIILAFFVNRFSSRTRKHLDCARLFHPAHAILLDKILAMIFHCKNPDFRQDPSQALSPAVTLTVATFQEASQACEAYIAKYDLGGGHWHGGQICEEGRPLARVSYNGRGWGIWQGTVCMIRRRRDSIVLI